MKKQDLKTGMVVEFGGDGHLGLVIGNSINDLTTDEADSWGGCSLNDFTDDLVYSSSSVNPWTINKVYAEIKHGAGSGLYLKMKSPRQYLCHNLLWERTSTEMTLAEVCKALGKDIKIVK